MSTSLADFVLFGSAGDVPDQYSEEENTTTIRTSCPGFSFLEYALLFFCGHLRGFADCSTFDSRIGDQVLVDQIIGQIWSTTRLRGPSQDPHWGTQGPSKTQRYAPDLPRSHNVLGGCVVDACARQGKHLFVNRPDLSVGQPLDVEPLFHQTWGGPLQCLA